MDGDVRIEPVLRRPRELLPDARAARERRGVEVPRSSARPAPGCLTRVDGDYAASDGWTLFVELNQMNH
ncbi:MAG: hypothetical protein A2Y55_03795 [Actinobacteria bacterium RBG_16_68_12]|nr:MAG: hypothetical protein A2Y55_03795 [Actinobacteria bacterium RBG_16_68_12]